MYINNEYEKQGDLNIKELFTLENINSEVEEYTEGIKDGIDSMLENIDSKQYNESKFGKHCENPKECPLPEFDWNFLPQYSVFNLYNIRVKKAMEYYNGGFLDMKDLTPDIKLNSKQRIQVDCEIDNKTHVDSKGIKLFLNTLEYPLYYIDFETYNPAIPVYDNMKPYQRIPFQFSLHIQHKPKGKLEHKEFLSDGKKDPREEFISLIKDWCGDNGSIITFNKAFEKGVLNETTKFLPKYQEWLDTINERIIDLLDVFRDFNYYNPKQEGSCSIKKVLPSIYPEKNHKHLDISDGMTASIEYEKSVWEYTDKKQIEKIRKNLLDYCCLDTIAMVYIKEELEKL